MDYIYCVLVINNCSHVQFVKSYARLYAETNRIPYTELVSKTTFIKRYIKVFMLLIKDLDDKRIEDIIINTEVPEFRPSGKVYCT